MRVFHKVLATLVVCGSYCSAHATSVPPTGATTEGIDVSQFQGAINWAMVASDPANIRFAIARVGNGQNIDSSFAQNWSGIASVGLIRGGYWFFRPSLDATTQANQYVTTVGARGSRDLPPILDVEVTDGLQSAPVIAGISTWVDQVRAATRRNPIIYTSSGFWVGLGDPMIPGTSLWIANWGVSIPNIPNAWTTWVLWQYSDLGSVSGVSGSVYSDRFNGSLTELEAFADRNFMNGFEP